MLTLQVQLLSKLSQKEAQMTCRTLEIKFTEFGTNISIQKFANLFILYCKLIQNLLSQPRNCFWFVFISSKWMHFSHNDVVAEKCYAWYRCRAQISRLRNRSMIALFPMCRAGVMIFKEKFLSSFFVVYNKILIHLEHSVV